MKEPYSLRAAVSPDSVASGATCYRRRSSIGSRVRLLSWFLLILSTAVSCASHGPQMPVEPFRCFDSDGTEIPCVDEMDCHEDSVKEQA
jgi:hypothetical protein